MELPYYGIDNGSTRSFMLPSKTLHTRNGLHFVESLAKGVPYPYPKHYRLVPMLLITLHKMKIRPYYICHQTLRNRDWYPTSPLLD